MTNGLSQKKNNKLEKIIWKYESGASKMHTVFYVTNLGIIYKIRSSGIILSPQWSEIKSISHTDLDYILVIWDSCEGSRWKYKIPIKKNAQTAMDQITQANLEWAKELKQNEGFSKILERRGLGYKFSSGIFCLKL